MTHTTHPAPGADADGRNKRRARSLVNLWHDLMERIEVREFDRNDALNLVTCTIELGKLGYTLTADETDWQLKETEHDANN